MNNNCGFKSLHAAITKSGAQRRTKSLWRNLCASGAIVRTIRKISLSFCHCLFHLFHDDYQMNNHEVYNNDVDDGDDSAEFFSSNPANSTEFCHCAHPS